VYEVAEPEVDPKMMGAEINVPVADVDVLIYEDGPHDAETLAVHPRTGAITVVTKDATGESGLYVAQEQMVPGISLLHRVATISFKRIARPQRKSDFDATSRLLTTGGDISPDGRRLVVRTYVEAFEWDISKGIASGVKGKAARIVLPVTKQGEAIAYSRDGLSLITTSEQLPTPVHRVPPAR
jgi:hypothetical protein